MTFLMRKKKATPSVIACRRHTVHAVLILSLAAAPPPGAHAQQPASKPLLSEHSRQQIMDFEAKQAQVKTPSDVTLSADGLQIAWTVEETVPGSTATRAQIFTAPLASPEKAQSLPVPAAGQSCNAKGTAWAPDNHTLAFFSDCNSPNQLQVFTADIHNNQAPHPLTHLKGYVSHLQWSPNGKSLSLLYVESGSRAPTPLAAEDKAIGVIDDLQNRDVQRVALVDSRNGETRQITPANLYIFEYDWSPDGNSLAYTAAPPPGDDNWYIAQLYTQPVAVPQPVSIFKPKLQMALPRWSPDGRSIAFIQGLMSDEGATGGEIYQLPEHGGVARDLTPGRTSSPAWFTWLSDREMLFSEYRGGATTINTLEIVPGKVNGSGLSTTAAKTKEVWSKGETILASPEAASLAIAGHGDHWTGACVRTSWSMFPEVWAGTIGDLKQITHLNAAVPLTLPKAESVTWRSNEKTGDFPVQGWLLFPSNYDPSKKYPMLVAVHGGPAWIAQPSWKAEDFNTTIFASLGYFVLFPNDRGSYGHGEKFTQANRRDWGFGDLQDLVTGVDEVVKRYPVDGNRVGILGWSYGGSTSMMAVTRTHRFRAAVAGAGASNMQSYYGQNSIDKWMIPYLGASVYDDPAAYMRVSAVTYIKNAKTPTLILVGELDGEAPPVQSMELWHGLKELGVPTQLVIYADEGHSFFKPADRTDLTLRSLEWFQKYMGLQ